jgi:DNA modification methylase
MLELREIITYDNNGELVIVGGNMRYKALKELGYKTALVKVLPADTPKEVINAFIIKDNAQFGEWDIDLLANEWDKDKLDDWGVEIDWAVEAPEQPKEAEEDDFSEEEAQQAPAIVKKGEIWQLGEHRLMCGDSTDIEQVKMLMGGVLADMVFTDPPYGVSYTEKNEYLNSLGKPMACPKAIENDSKTPTEMYDFWLKAFRVLYEVTNEKMAYYITAPQGGDLLLLLPLQAVRDAGFALKHQLIWNKNNHVLGRCDYNYKHEPIIYGWKIKGTHDFVGGGKFKTSVWDIPKPLRNDLHPTMKPIELVAECLKDNTREGNVVIDVFGGSGTTLIAAEQLNRKAFLMEFDEHYCDVIIARWEKLTGKKAERITHA